MKISKKTVACVLLVLASAAALADNKNENKDEGNLFCDFFPSFCVSTAAATGGNGSGNEPPK